MKTLITADDPTTADRSATAGSLKTVLIPESSQRKKIWLQNGSGLFRMAHRTLVKHFLLVLNLLDLVLRFPPVKCPLVRYSLIHVQNPKL